MRRIFHIVPLYAGGAKQCSAIIFLLCLIVIGFITIRGKTSDIDVELRVSPNYVRLNEFIAVAIELSQKSGKIIKDVKTKHAEDVKVKGKTNEGMDEPVTVADNLSNSIFVNGIRQRFSDLELLSEETEPAVDNVQTIQTKHSLALSSEYFAKKSNSFVTIDPLDATQEYSEDLVEYVTTMVCLVENNRPVVGILQSVFSDEIIVAVPSFHFVGKLGSTDSIINAMVSPESSNRIVVSRSHTGGAADVIKEKLSDEFVSFPAGGSGYKSLFLVKGRAKAYLHTTKIKVWDVCAADALITAAGGIMTDLDGNALKYEQGSVAFEKGLLATMDHDLHSKILSKLKQ